MIRKSPPTQPIKPGSKKKSSTKEKNKKNGKNVKQARARKSETAPHKKLTGNITKTITSRKGVTIKFTTTKKNETRASDSGIKNHAPAKGNPSYKFKRLKTLSLGLLAISSRTVAAANQPLHQTALGTTANPTYYPPGAPPMEQSERSKITESIIVNCQNRQIVQDLFDNFQTRCDNMIEQNNKQINNLHFQLGACIGGIIANFTNVLNNLDQSKKAEAQQYCKNEVSKNKDVEKNVCFALNQANNDCENTNENLNRQVQDLDLELEQQQEQCRQQQEQCRQQQEQCRQQQEQQQEQVQKQEQTIGGLAIGTGLLAAILIAGGACAGVAANKQRKKIRRLKQRLQTQTAQLPLLPKLSPPYIIQQHSSQGIRIHQPPTLQRQRSTSV